jgi:hypothetical protein
LSSVHADFARASAREPAQLAIKQLDAVRAFYQTLNADKALAGVYLSLARPGATAQQPALEDAFQVASASAEVLKHWYTRSRGPVN